MQERYRKDEAEVDNFLGKSRKELRAYNVKISSLFTHSAANRHYCWAVTMSMLNYG